MRNYIISRLKPSGSKDLRYRKIRSIQSERHFMDTMFVSPSFSEARDSCLAIIVPGYLVKSQIARGEVPCGCQ